MNNKIEARTFMEMSECAADTGLCKYCDLIPFSSNPNTGGDFCEGEHCEYAYGKYITSKFPDGVCDHCKNKGWETMNKVAQCNCCDSETYNYFEPDDSGEIEVEITMDDILPCGIKDEGDCKNCGYACKVDE